ncbi:MAG: hypothetical protein ABSF95_16365 [Verrucomicrobiota bacterium]|jgi:hypothetical protein
MGRAEDKPPDITEPQRLAGFYIAHNLELIRKHWKAFASVAFLAFSAGFALAWYLVVASKNATIETLQTSITNLRPDNEKLQKANDKLTRENADLKLAASRNDTASQFLLDNLYSNVVFETFSPTNTDRVRYDVLPNKDLQIFFKLKHAPIPNSLQGTFCIMYGDNGYGPNSPIENPIAHIRNVGTMFIYGIWSYTNSILSDNNSPIKGPVLTLQYVKDNRETNLFQNIEIRNKDLLLDGKRFDRPTEP